MRRITLGKFPELGYATNEGLNTLCMNLTFAGEHVRRIMITSCQPSEGKSYISINMMRTFTQLGHSVALVDADLRRSNLAHSFRLQFPDHQKLGLTHLLAGMAEEEDVIYDTDIGDCLLVPAGRNVSNSLSLLNSPRFSHLLDTLSTMVDYILVDSPPVGSIIDAAEIAKSCDGSVIVVTYNRVTRQELKEAKHQLEQTSCPILGAVLNRVEFDNYLSRKYYKSYYYKYDYDNQEHSTLKPAQLSPEKAVINNFSPTDEALDYVNEAHDDDYYHYPADAYQIEEGEARDMFESAGDQPVHFAENAVEPFMSPEDYRYSPTEYRFDAQRVENEMAAEEQSAQDFDASDRSQSATDEKDEREARQNHFPPVRKVVLKTPEKYGVHEDLEP